MFFYQDFTAILFLQDILHQHPIHAISFSADDKRGRAGNMLAYIAKGKPPARENICYVFEVKPKQVRDFLAMSNIKKALYYNNYSKMLSLIFYNNT